MRTTQVTIDSPWRLLRTGECGKVRRVRNSKLTIIVSLFWPFSGFQKTRQFHEFRMVLGQKSVERAGCAGGGTI
jgi:hypothetical protein